MLPPQKFGKRKRGYLLFANKYNYLIQNNIVIIKLNFNGRIVDAVEVCILECRTDY